MGEAAVVRPETGKLVTIKNASSPQSELRKSGRGLSLLLVGLSVYGVPGRALACGACECSTPPRILPAAELSSTDLPLNARFLVELRSFHEHGRETLLPLSSVRWTKEDSLTPVELEAEDSGNGHQFWIIPSAPLIPETDYTLELHDGELALVTHSFRTGTTEDHSPPSAGALTAVPPGNPGECPHSGFNLTWASMTDADRSFDYSPIVEVVMEGKDQRTVLFVDGRKGKDGFRALLASSDESNAGRCWGSALLPLSPTDEPLDVTVALYDRAGNKSAPTSLQTQLARHDPGGCPDFRSCSWTSPARSPAAGGWLSLGVIALILTLRSYLSASASRR